MPLVAITLPVFFGFGSFAIDYSYVMAAQQALQATTDASALAAAQQITGSNTPATVTSAAARYSASVGNKNKLPFTAATMVSGYPAIKCLKSTGVSCTGTEGGNAVLVKQQATVDLFLAQAIGFKSTQVTATSLAAKGGTAQALNVMLVLDTTASMQQLDPNCSILGTTKLACALGGVRTVLSQLDPTIDQVGLMVFPGLTSASQVGYEYCNPKGKITPAPYNGSPVYQIIGLTQKPVSGQSQSSDFRTSNNSGLNVSSNLVRAAGGDASSCSGLQDPGGQGTYFADVITAAQAALAANSRTGVQNVMIFLSDGDATSSSVSSAKAKNECHQGITSADAAAAAGTWIYSIAYGATMSGCTTDSPKISPCATMQQIASDASKFYSDGADGCTSNANPTTELVSIFRKIALSLTTARLVDLNTA